MRVSVGRVVQAARYAGRPARTNGAARLPFSEAASFLSPEAFAFLTRAADRMALSGRAVGKVARVARTIADLAGEARAGLPHVAEAIQYRLPEFAPEDGKASPSAVGRR